MKSVLVIAAALALCGSAFANTQHHARHNYGVIASAKQEAHQISTSARQDFHRIVRGDKFRQEQAMDQSHMRSQTTRMGAGPAYRTSRQARMDAAYADWQRSHR